MGKPYQSELADLPLTYDWVLKADIEPVIAALRRASALPLIAVGSGGSFTTASFTAQCHQHFFNRLAKAVTPLELMAGTPEKEATYVILTAAGKNRDILASFRHLVEAEPSNIIVLCTAVGSPLQKLAHGYSWVDRVEYALPSGKDGFVATNSLFASCVLVARAFGEAAGTPVPLPASFADLGPDPTTFGEDIPKGLSEVLGREYLLVIHDNPTRSAAVDIESKFSEAALGAVQICDLRSFAHGRHHWLAKRGDSTGILTLHTNEFANLMRRTTRLLPASVPIADVAVEGDCIVGGVRAVVNALYIAGAAGRIRGIDPGKPGVPSYGSRIYNLSAFGRQKREPAESLSRAERCAIERKSRTTTAELAARGLLEYWQDCHRKFCDSLDEAKFGAIVFDYDGTLCDPANRFDGLRKEVSTALSEMLERGILIGIATGRGGSVRDDLRRHITDSTLQANLLIGYHNGAEIATLADESQPPEKTELTAALKPVWQLLAKDPRTHGFAELRPSTGQITVRPNRGAEEMIWPAVRHYAAICGVPVVRSSHSLDVIAPDVSKRLLVEAVHRRLTLSSARAVLIIGDQGEWPGNDYELLSMPHSLSVDQVSPDPATCWNLLPPGLRGAQGVLWYLSQLRLKKNQFAFKSASLK